MDVAMATIFGFLHNIMRCTLGDHLWADKATSISPSQPDQLSLLPSLGREISTSQSEVTFCGPGVKAGLFHFG